MIKYLFKYLIAGSVILAGPLVFFSCNEPVSRDFTKEIDSISKKWVPDKREGIFDALLLEREGVLTLKGETSIPEARSELTELLSKNGLKFIDSLLILPDTAVIRQKWGLVNVSVCNMRSEPSHGAEMLSQALLGTPVKILKKRGGWYMIQTPDRYLGWTDGDAVKPLPDEKYMKWKSSPRVIFLEKFGDISGDKDGKIIVSDITAGCILENEGEENGFYRVAFPDGRKGFAPVKQFQPFNKWAVSSKPAEGNLLPAAMRFMGTPYLWGGTSAKGLDCSGFVKTVYFLNGLILARDVSLQIRHGLEVPSKENLDSLKPGDLMFFGSVRNGKVRATHVGMFIGDSEFIHESGMVWINSFDSTRANFNRFRKNTFLGARRIIGEYPAEGLQLVSEHPWYN
jgi:hypothetical protein